MSRLSSKPSIARLVQICAAKGIKYAVISPGSRNAPLIISLDEHPDITCLNIPDERVAGFMAMGMAQELNEPVILCCTSGSAGLNYAPAIVEAYYQKLPLLVLTADRPPEWVDQRAGQTMRQESVFSNYIKQSFSLVCEPNSEDNLWFNDRMVNQAIDCAMLGGAGPVHINVPLHEPLYGTIPMEEAQQPKLIHSLQRENVFSKKTESELLQLWSQYEKVLVVIGQHNRSDVFDRAVEQLALLDHVVVVTETTSNVVAEGVYRSIDRLIDSMIVSEYDSFAPDLIISCGGALVSKKLRFMLRDMRVKGHWHVDESDQFIDTYKALTLNVPMMLEELVPILMSTKLNSHDSNWKEGWMAREVSTRAAHDRYLASGTWSDLYAIHALHEKVPTGIWHVANSTPVRYTQLFETRVDLTYRSNRGVSGIDGCTSTAMGAAFVVEDIVTIVTGDIAFFYDSNAFWHHHIPSNLRVIMINNEGGNIFRYVKGPMETDQFEKHFEAHHKTSAKGVAMTHGIAYLAAQDEASLELALEEIYAPDYDQCVIVEIFTPREENINILKNYFAEIKHAIHP